MSEQVRWVAVYERVSSDDQRERETIKTQTDVIDRYLAVRSDFRVYRRYHDDGVTGKLPLRERPEGGRLLADALAGKFQAIVMTRPDRLGRNEIDRLQIFTFFQELEIELIGVCEPFGDEFVHGIHAIVDGHYLRRLLALSKDGMTRAANEGRYCGGIVPLGFKVVGEKQTARLVPSDVTIWGNWTEAGLVRHIYRRLAVDGWSCRRAADELNALRVPTAYEKDGREVERKGDRKRRTQGKWRAGRIRNLVANPVYKGLLQYGRRSKKGREVISASINELVSEEIWNAAQETLARNRVAPKNGQRTYLLRSRIICGTCGLHYCGSKGRGVTTWYRCDGQMVDRGPLEGRCPSKSIKGEVLEPIVWDVIETFLRNPGEILNEIAEEMNGGGTAAAVEADRTTLQASVQSMRGQKDRILDLFRKELISEEDVAAQLRKIGEEEREIAERLEALEAVPVRVLEPIPPDLLAEIRSRLPQLDDRQRQEIVSLLVDRIVINTEFVDGKKEANAIVDYRFPAVDETFRGIPAGQNYTVRRVVRL